MNEKEVAELRRRFRQDRSGISHIRGCYVNENREIVSQFDQSLGVLTQEENEKLLQLLRRTPHRDPGQEFIGRHLRHPAGGPRLRAQAAHGPADLPS